MIALRVHQGRLESRGDRPEDIEQMIALRDLWEERAGILEYQAGFSREDAETKALEELMPILRGEAA